MGRQGFLRGTLAAPWKDMRLELNHDGLAISAETGDLEVTRSPRPGILVSLQGKGHGFPCLHLAKVRDVTELRKTFAQALEPLQLVGYEPEAQGRVDVAGASRMGISLRGRRDREDIAACVVALPVRGVRPGATILLAAAVLGHERAKTPGHVLNDPVLAPIVASLELVARKSPATEKLEMRDLEGLGASAPGNLDPL
jgi:hypothetical protein